MQQLEGSKQQQAAGKQMKETVTAAQQRHVLHCVWEPVGKMCTALHCGRVGGSPNGCIYH